MDRYGGSGDREVGSGSQPDPSSEWTDPGNETGLAEGVWQMGLGEVDPTVAGSGYPERPDEADCIYYLRTGFCGYGPRCRFNHPPRDRGMVLGGGRVGAGEFPERIGQPLCQYYMRTGTCKYGASCKYHHPRHAVGTVSAVSLNYYGYPLRPGEKECTYYMKTGQCKFGSTCKFHHPQPTNVQVPAQSPAPQVAPLPAAVPPPALYPSVQSPSDPSSQQYGVIVARPPMLPGYVQGPYGPMLFSPGVVSYPSWTHYPAPMNSMAPPGVQPAAGSGSVYGMTPLSPSAPAYTGTYQPVPASIGPSSSSVKEPQFPERPGQTQCQHYMKTGFCKYGASCRYHHPPELVAQKASVVLSPMDLPLNPSAPVCSHYTQRGWCKFGPACKFDHPMGSLTYSPSASSLADMPVAPYPVGSLVGHLAPCSSSSDLRPELISGLSKEPTTSKSSSMSASSGSISSITSKSGPAVQQSGQSSGPSTSGNASIKEAPTSS